jgi:outer membrane lipoprotein-sorting protein
MFTLKQFVIAVLTGSLLLAMPMHLWAQEPQALKILQTSDDVVSAPKDQHSFMTMLLIDKSGDQKERKSEMFERAKADMRLVRFLAPADQKGISFLSLPDDKMYLYLPAFKKIRTIASHVKNESFAGTDMSYDDISTQGYAKDHDPKLLETTDEFYILELTPKPGTEKDYIKLKLSVRKDNFFPAKTEYYDQGGKVWKVMERRQIEKIGEYWISKETEMKDLRKEHSTKSLTDTIELDTGLTDEVFSQRNLKKSE